VSTSSAGACRYSIGPDHHPRASSCDLVAKAGSRPAFKVPHLPHASLYGSRAGGVESHHVMTYPRRGAEMSVLTIASSKGGPGKTTVCQLLAGSLADESKLVLLDSDPSQALSRWAKSAYEGVPFETVAEPDETRLAHLIAAKADIADLVIVDTAGFRNRAASVAMTSADAVIVPTLSGEADVTEAEKTMQLIDGLSRAARREIPARVLLNRVRKTTLARHAVAEVTAAGLAQFTATLSDLVAYGEMTYSGRVPTAGLAGAEVATLIAELRELGWVPVSKASRAHVRP
jgi:chromosome partitioning protein